MARGSLYELPENLPDGEFIEDLLLTPNLRMERILSRGDVTPPGEWYEQDRDEWVVLLSGGAILEYGTGERDVLAQGDWVLIPAHRRHRVAWTSSDPPCLWLALFGDLQGRGSGDLPGSCSS